MLEGTEKRGEAKCSEVKVNTAVKGHLIPKCSEVNQSEVSEVYKM